MKRLSEPRHDKTSRMTVRPAKTQISLGISPVWSVSSLSAWRKPGILATHWAHSKDSDQTGRMTRLIWVFAGRTLIFWFCHVTAHFVAIKSTSDLLLCGWKCLVYTNLFAVDCETSSTPHSWWYLSPRGYERIPSFFFLFFLILSTKQGKHWYHFFNPWPPTLETDALPLGDRGGWKCGPHMGDGEVCFLSPLK